MVKDLTKETSSTITSKKEARMVRADDGRGSYVTLWMPFRLLERIAHIQEQSKTGNIILHVRNGEILGSKFEDMETY